jgi:hypothetical protein
MDNKQNRSFSQPVAVPSQAAGSGHTISRATVRASTTDVLAKRCRPETIRP